MAFEDRCSPNQANSPGPMANGSPTNHSSPTSSPSPNPNERALKPYTCSTITSKYDRTKSPSDRMISSNMAYVKTQGIVTLPVNMTSNEIDESSYLPNRNHQNVIYNPYLNPYVIMNGNSPLRSFVGAAFDARPLLVHHQNFSPPHHIANHPQQINGIDTEDHNTNLQFSISNILRPEFGLNAIRKSTNKIEGPKAGGPIQSILYKPYELAKQSHDVRNIQIKTQNDYNINGRTLSSKKSMEIRNARLPLGGLHHAVSQIGVVKPIPSKHTSNGFADPGRASSNHSQIERPKNFASFHAATTSVEESCRPGSANSSISTASSSIAAGSDDGTSSKAGDSSNGDQGKGQQWPAWVYCTRYSDRPSSGPRSRRSKKKPSTPSVSVPPAPPVASGGGSSGITANGAANGSSGNSLEDKRPRTAFSGSQLARLKHEFAENRYLTERRRQHLSSELGLNEAQIKIWFQNKRAKIKKASGQKNPLALQLMAQGLYNHGTASCSEGEDEDVEVGSVAGN